VLSHDELDANDVETFVLRQTKLLPTLGEVPKRYQAMVFRGTQIAPTWSNCLAFIQSENFESVRESLLETPIPDSEEALPLRQFLINAEDLSDIDYRVYIRILPREFRKLPDATTSSKRRILIDERRVTFNAENLVLLDGEVDLQTEFVAQNIASYLRDPCSFSIDDDFHE